MANIMRLGGSSGGDGLNIAYGTTPPEDTSKLWIPLATKPNNVEIDGDSLQSAVDTVQTTIAKLVNKSVSHAAVAIKGKAYIFGGYTTTSTPNNIIQEYDPITDTITTKGAVLALGANFFPAVAINGKAYIFGNSGNVKQICEYDPATDTVTVKAATLLYSGNKSAAVAIKGKAYIFGGYTTNETKIIQEYDPTTDTIVEKAAALYDRMCDIAAEVVNGKAYLLGGSDADHDAVDYIQEYDPLTDTLTKKTAVLPAVRRYSSAVSINGKIYLLGGRNNSTSSGSGYNDEICEYDPLTDTLTVKEVTLVGTSANAAAVAIDGRAYLFGGHLNGTVSDAIQKYTPKDYLGANCLKIFASVYRSAEHQVVTNIVNGKKEQLKLYMTSAFIGDDDGYAKAQDAYVYDEANSEWQALDGTSMTTDMLNALAELGVT